MMGWDFRFLLDLTGRLQQLVVKAEVAIERLRDRSQRKLCARVSEGVETVHRKGSGYVDRGRDRERDREEEDKEGEKKEEEEKEGRGAGGPVLPVPSGT